MSNNDEGKSFNPSWFLVVLMLGVFWPVGLYMLYCKLKAISNPQNAQKRERRMSLGGVAMMLFALFMLMTDGGFGGFPLFLLLGGAALFAFDGYMKKRNSRFRKYASVIGSRATMTVGAIAGAMGVTTDAACKDLQHMIDERYFSDTAYLDLGEGLFVSDSRFAPEAKAQPRPQAAQRKTPAPEQQAQPARPEPSQASASGDAPNDEESLYVQKLQQIRALNDAIKDEKVSKQIEQIEQSTANIFEAVVQCPGKRPQIHTFMNYYLPTTLKLLTAYSRLEKQGVSGANIDASKKKIEQLLDQLVWAFAQQNDQMFADEALDISSDIKVMETMMAKDGLGDGGLPKNPFAQALKRG
ncbi:MAG: 5-bromo-4-chloroindolyl phosphate hydrolysis family protein [Clostridia bacterium]